MEIPPSPTTLRQTAGLWHSLLVSKQENGQKEPSGYLYLYTMSSYTLTHNKYSSGSVWRVCGGVSDGRSDRSLVNDECGIDVRRICWPVLALLLEKFRDGGEERRHDMTLRTYTPLQHTLGIVISSIWEARPGFTTIPEWQFGWILFILISMYLERQTDGTGQQSLPSIKMILSMALLAPGLVNWMLGTSYGTVLPAEVDGTSQPPVGSPGVHLSLIGNALYNWRTTMNWATPSSSVLSAPQVISVASFTQLCPSASCVPQSGVSQKLDGLGDRLLNRLVYRRYATHDSLVVTHGVSANGAAGCRWYELRSITSGTTYVYQQSTYAPADGTWRWMGTMSQDKAGNIALGFAGSKSSGGYFPSLLYTGRLAGDPLNTMTQGETIAMAGIGTQSIDRWGDYGQMNIDPTDDCTFWLTHEYMGTGGFDWRTRITSFKLPGCSAATSSTRISTSSPTRRPSKLPTRAPNSTPAPTRRPSRLPTRSPATLPMVPAPVPTKRPTRRPTAAPASSSLGTCANPFTIVAGNNGFTNRATGTTLAMSGTTCTFSVTPQSISNSNFYK